MIAGGWRLSEADRFWSNVTIGDGCWEWTGALTRGGYGRFRGSRHQYARTDWFAHRYGWVQWFGEIPRGLLVCHKCDNRKCVRPSHLFLGTYKDNTQDMMAKGRLVVGRRYPGSQHCRAKLNEAQVVEIRRRRAAGESGVALGREYGVAPTQIYYIMKGKTWKHVPAGAAA